MNTKLQPYFPIADMIAATFGPACEVAIHDLSQPETSVVYVAGHVTGREVGQSFDHLVKDVLLNKNYRDSQVSNYIFQTKDGRTIKSSTAFIRDGKEVIGAFCVNCDITVSQQFYEQLRQELQTAPVQETQEKVETNDDVVSIIDELIENILKNMDLTNLNRKKSVEIVKFMDDKGIFLVKGAIDKVAARLGVSKVTIYSYLDEAKGKR